MWQTIIICTSQGGGAVEWLLKDILKFGKIVRYKLMRCDKIVEQLEK